MPLFLAIIDTMLTLSFADTCAISRVRYLLYSHRCNLTNSLQNRDPRCGGSLCLGDALGDRQNRLSSFVDRGIPAVLPRAPQADILFT